MIKSIIKQRKTKSNRIAVITMCSKASEWIVLFMAFCYYRGDVRIAELIEEAKVT